MRVQPFNFAAAAEQAVADPALGRTVGGAVLRQYHARRQRLAELPDAEGLRSLVAQIKDHTLANLDFYLDELRANVEAAGGTVHFAATADDARRIVTELAAVNNCRRIVKSKSMLSEEIGLTQHLESLGLDVVETDLGEFIAQIARHAPSHLVCPIVHMNRRQIAQALGQHLKISCSDDPNELTQIARAHLRAKFRAAEMGITGGNFLIAQTGQVCIVENEANGRQTLTVPRVLVSVVGIEKVIPRLEDLAVMLKLLARSATGQPMTVYTHIFGGPRLAGEKDGPEQFHLVLVDNGRSRILGSEYREVLRCIRCGACLAACPVYRQIGGHGYGHAYCGPIGAVIAPLLFGMDRFWQVAQASTLCGACAEACPMKIDLPQMLINLRRDAVAGKFGRRRERWGYRLWAWVMKSPRRYRFFSWLQRRKLRRLTRKTGWTTTGPGPLATWTGSRDLPAPPAESFASWWKKRGGEQ